MRIHRCADPAQLALAAARYFILAAQQAIAARGVFHVGLAGGRTPQRLYQSLRDAPLEWPRLVFYWSDERFVPADDPLSNEGMARAALLDFVPDARAVPMVCADTPQACAALYERQLPDRLDLVLLGLGADGHTASLFPGSPAVHEIERKVIVARASGNGAQRISLSVPYLRRARQVCFLVTGADKAPALHRLLHGAEDWDSTPAQAVARHAHDVAVFADAPAWGDARAE
jgi:6-phosphogluconolactonase